MANSPIASALRNGIVLLALLLAVEPAVATDTPLKMKIGVLVPQDVFHSSVQEQIEAAARISMEVLEPQGAENIKIKFVPGDFAKSEAVLAAYKKLHDEGANVIVGGMPGASTAALGNTLERFETPTIILGEQAGTADTRLKDNVLKLGVPASEAYAKNLRYWIDKENIGSLSVLFGGDDELEYKYGEMVTQMALQGLRSEARPNFKFSDISTFGKILPEQYDKVIGIPREDSVGKNEIRTSPDGIVISSPFHEKLSVLSTFKEAIEGVPVFIAPPVASTMEVGALAKRTNRSVYYSTEFWATPEFVDAMKKELALRDGQLVHPYAVAIHDAVQIAGTALLAQQGNKLAGKVWATDKLDGVKGAGGELKLLEDHIVAARVGLLAGGPDGKVSYLRAPSMW